MNPETRLVLVFTEGQEENFNILIHIPMTDFACIDLRLHRPKAVDRLRASLANFQN